MKTIGIIGGMGWESSATYYRVMNRAVRAQLGGFHSARIILDSLDFHSIAEAQSQEEFEDVRRELVESALRLERASADLLIIACNTVHRFAQSVVDRSSIPLLHIADAAGAALVKDGHHRIGLLGTQATMHGSFYKKRLKNGFELDVIVPDQESRAEVNAMIVSELASGSSPEACAPRLDTVIDALKAEGATAVLLACTEFGLAFGSQDASVVHRTLPAYDTAVLHAQAAVSLALDQVAQGASS